MMDEQQDDGTHSKFKVASVEDKTNKRKLSPRNMKENLQKEHQTVTQDKQNLSK